MPAAVSLSLKPNHLDHTYQGVAEASITEILSLVQPHRSINHKPFPV